MTARHRFLVAYDVSDDTRLRRMHRTMCNFGDALQYSVFSCDLSPSEYVLFENQVLTVMNAKEDRLLVADLGPLEGRAGDAVRRYGVAELPTTRRAVIV